jgi:RNA polymerase sigma-70 factor (ECF subfamily)
MSPNEPSKIVRSTPASDSMSRSLLVRLRTMDSDAWEQLLSLYAPLVYHWCQKMGLEEQDIPDVVQEVFKSVSTGIHRFHKDRPDDTFRGWLRTITRSKAFDHYRRQQRQPKATGGSVAQRRMTEFEDFVDDESVDQSGDSAYDALFLRALDVIRNDFHEHTWQAFWRVVVDGRSAAEVAEELSMRPGTVRVAKSRVLHRLRQELGELLE